MPPLTEVKLKFIKASGKIESFYDDRGLYLELSLLGGKPPWPQQRMHLPIIIENVMRIDQRFRITWVCT